MAMKHKKQIFQGNARVYLQGKGALQLVDKSNAQCYTYFIGSMESEIKIKDFRQEPIQAAQATIEGRFDLEFAEVFNEPAQIKIVNSEDSIEIEMHPGKDEGNPPTLWMGTIIDGKMPVQKTEWEEIRPIYDGRVAFAALVKN